MFYKIHRYYKIMIIVTSAEGEERQLEYGC